MRPKSLAQPLPCLLCPALTLLLPAPCSSRAAAGRGLAPHSLSRRGAESSSCGRRKRCCSSRILCCARCRRATVVCSSTVVPDSFRPHAVSPPNSILSSSLISLFARLLRARRPPLYCMPDLGSTHVAASRLCARPCVVDLYASSSASDCQVQVQVQVCGSGGDRRARALHCPRHASAAPL